MENVIFIKVNLPGNFVFSKKITPVLVKAVQKGLLAVERDAKRNAPVDTGRLRSSITHDVSVKAGEVLGRVGTNVAYGAFVEYGTGQIGKMTASAKGVIAPSWYRYGAKMGHYVPLSKAPDLIRWLERKAKYRVVPVGQGRYDIYYKGTNTLVRRATKWWRVSGAAQPFLTPAFVKHTPAIINEIKKAVVDYFEGSG